MADPRPCYCQRGDAPMVAVPAEGTWLVRDGKATEAEADLTRCHARRLWEWRVWTDPLGDPDG